MADSATGSSAAPSLSRDEVLRLAHLARLELTDDEAERFTDQLSSILAYIEQLNAVPVTPRAEVPPAEAPPAEAPPAEAPPAEAPPAEAPPAEAPQERDARSNPASATDLHLPPEVHPLSLSTEIALDNAPQTTQDLIVVPPVVAVEATASGPDPISEIAPDLDADPVTP